MLGSGNSVGPLVALLAISAAIGGSQAKPPSRINGGRLANEYEFSGTVTLSNPGNFVHACGAGIIGPRHILTAGHCVAKKTSNDISVRAGIHNIGDYDHVVERLVSKVIMHPDYVPYIQGSQAVQHDLAILVLKQDLPFGDRISAYKLPTHQPGDELYFVAGWGANSPDPTVYQHDLKAIDVKTCPTTSPVADPDTICAFSENGGICGGDSGSPLIKGGYIYGITSTSVSCNYGADAHFVNVYHYHNWITDVIRQNPY